MTPAPGNLVELRNVFKRFGQVQAIEGLTLGVPAARTIVLIGPSGCGKSTVLRLIIGLIWPDEGRVCLGDDEVKPRDILQLRQRMGYVIQDGGLFPHLTARRNVTLMADYLGWSRERTQKRVIELVDLTRFPRDGLERYPVELSGGQRQRVSLMRALMLDPDVLLLDEPLGALDPMIRSDLQADLRRIFQTLGKTVVLVTHDMGEAGFFGDEIALLREGRMVQRGTLASFVDAPAEPFVTQFINAQRGPLAALEKGPR